MITIQGIFFAVLFLVLIFLFVQIDTWKIKRRVKRQIKK